MKSQHVEIRYMRGTLQFGRHILFGQLYSLVDNMLILDSSLAMLLKYISEHDLVLVNSQELLTYVVITNGLGS